MCLLICSCQRTGVPGYLISSLTEIKTRRNTSPDPAPIGTDWSGQQLHGRSPWKGRQSGDYSTVVPPGSISNPEVKRCCADGSGAFGLVRVGRCQFFPTPSGGWVFLCPDLDQVDWSVWILPGACPFRDHGAIPEIAGRVAHAGFHFFPFFFIPSPTACAPR